jgi:hypothetical protein
MSFRNLRDHVASTTCELFKRAPDHEELIRQETHALSHHLCQTRPFMLPVSIKLYRKEH